MLEFDTSIFSFIVIRIVFFIIFVPRMMSDYAVETINDGIGEFNVEFRGPKDSMVSNPSAC